MRIFILVLLVCASLSAQNVKNHQSTDRVKCSQDAGLLEERVLTAMWNKDNPDNELPGGLITIAVSPNWDPQYFFSIRITEGHASRVAIYSLPKGKKYLSEVVKDVLKSEPCIDAEAIVTKLPISKRVVMADKELESVIAEFFSLKVVPHLSHSVRLDATEYDVQFEGEETIRFKTDRFESPVALWVDHFESVIDHQRKASNSLQ